MITVIGVHSIRVIVVKMKPCLLLILVIFAASPVALAAKSYDGYKVPTQSLELFVCIIARPQSQSSPLKGFASPCWR